MLIWFPNPSSMLENAPAAWDKGETAQRVSCIAYFNYMHLFTFWTFRTIRLYTQREIAQHIWVNQQKFIVWIPEALLGTALTFWLLPLWGTPILPFTLLMLIPSSLSIVLAFCLKLNENHNCNNWFLCCNPKFKEKVLRVCVWMMHICMWYMLTSHVWEHAFLCGWMPEENTDGLICHCHFYSFEQGLSLTLELGCQISCLCPPQCWCYSHARAMLRFLYVGAGIWNLDFVLVKHSDTLSHLTSSRKNYFSIYYEPKSSLWRTKFSMLKVLNFVICFFWIYDTNF